MKKNKIFLIVIITILVITLLIGGKMYMNKKEIQAQKNLLEVEKQSVLVLKNTFADIKEIQIKKTAYNKTTGSYRMFVKMTNTNNESINFSYGFWKEDNELGDYGVEDRNIQKKGETKSVIKVIYSDGTGGEV